MEVYPRLASQSFLIPYPFFPPPKSYCLFSFSDLLKLSLISCFSPGLYLTFAIYCEIFICNVMMNLFCVLTLFITV